MAETKEKSNEIIAETVDMSQGAPTLLLRGDDGEWTEQKIVRAIQTFNEIHFPLHERQDHDMSDYELDEYHLDDAYSDNITFNEPRHFGDMAVQLIQASVPVIEVAYEDEDHDKENACERFHISTCKSSDELLQRQLGGTLKGGAAFYGATRGWMVCRVTVHRDEQGRLVVMLVPCDPRFMSWGIARGRIAWAAYETWRTADSIYADYNVTVRDEDSKLTDFWSEKENVILVEDRQVERKGHNIGYPPFLILPCTTTPKVTGYGKGMSKSHISGWGESIFGANRGLYKSLNKILSIWMTLIVKANNPGGFLFTDDPSVTIEETPYGAGTVLPLPFTQTRWEELKAADIASSTPELFGQLASAVQRGGFPWVQYGQLWRGQELSGNALEELKEGVDKILIPLLQSLGLLYQGVARMVEEQFASYTTKWTGSGVDTRGRQFFTSIEPGDISGNHEIRYEFLSIRPQQEAANYAKGNMMKTSRLAPDEFIRKDIIRFQNPQLIEEQMAVQEAGEISPKIQMLRDVEALRKAGRLEEAQLLFEDLQMQRASEQIQFQQMMAQSMAPPQLPAGGQAGGPAPASAPAGPPTREEVRARLSGAARGGV